MGGTTFRSVLRILHWQELFEAVYYICTNSISKRGKLKEKKKLYIEAQRGAADYYQKSLFAENLLLIYHHLKEAGDNTRAVNSIVYNIEYFWREGFWLDVKRVLEESLDFSEDENIRTDILSYIGSIVHRLGERDKAIEYCEKSLEIKEKLGDIQGIANTYGNLGFIYKNKGEWDKAIEYFEKSLEIKEFSSTSKRFTNV